MLQKYPFCPQDYFKTKKVHTIDSDKQSKDIRWPWVEIIRNADSLVRSGVIPMAYKGGKYYQVVNLPDSFRAAGTTITIDVREPLPEETTRACNTLDASYPNFAIAKIALVDTAKY